MSWYRDSSTLSAIGSVGAVMIAIIALYFSYRGQSEQRLREQREELRSVLERLVELREDENALSKESDEIFRSNASGYQNTKRNIYLETAETLALRISRYVTASEFYVIGLENHWEADVRQARSWYKLAEQHFRETSPPYQAEILRSLASTYYVEDPALRDLSEGRATYLRAVRAVEGREDSYSYYTQSNNYLTWGRSEIYTKEFEEASDKLRHASDAWTKIPSDQGIGWGPDLRSLAYGWGQLGVAYFENRHGDVDLEKGRAAFREALNLMEMLSTTYGINNDYSTEARGLLLSWWGRKEHESGFHDEGEELFGRVETEFSRLSEQFVRRRNLLAEFEQVRSTLAEGKGAPSAGARDTSRPLDPRLDPLLKGVGVTPEVSPPVTQ